MTHSTTDGGTDVSPAVTEWLVNSDDPWVRYHTRVDLLGMAETDPIVVEDRKDVAANPSIQQLIADAAEWPGPVLKRHNDAKHMLHALPVLAELGVRADDPGMNQIIQTVLQHQSSEGPFETRLILPRAFGGTDEETLSWMLCDAPTTLYALLKLGVRDHPAIQRAIDHLADLVGSAGWPCASGAALGKVQGPGRKDDPCPYANLIALKALTAVPELHDHPAVHKGADMLLWHWEHQQERKLRMFGIGTDFRKLKYPFVWYDILHVTDTLSQLAWVGRDGRFVEMVNVITSKQDADGRYTPESVWLAWKAWDFGQKRQPSQWLTLLVLRILHRVGGTS